MEANELLSTKYLILGGTVVNADGSGQAGVAITDGRITAVGDLSAEDFPGYERLNAEGKLIFPGGIDPHVHLALPTSAGPSSDDFFTGSRAALAGGTTSIIDFVTPQRGQSLVEALRLRKTEASQSLCNYKLHLGISEWNEKVKEEVKFCMDHEGITSFKAYLAYRESIGISPAELRELMHVVAEKGGIVLVHCEDHSIISALRSRFITEGKTHGGYHALSRPAEAEISAIRQVLQLSEETSCKVYIVHTSTGDGARLIKDAKNRGLNVYGETCIQYLVLDESVYDLEKANTEVLPYLISPPIRGLQDQEQLWSALVDGTFDTVATDHCPFNLHGQKDVGMHNFTRVPNGAGGIEYRMALLFSEGVAKGRITPERFVQLTSSTAAGIFGWKNTKGRIAEDFDADLVILDPKIQWQIRQEEQFQHCDSNIYQGTIVTGKPVTVFLAGKKV